MKVRQEWIWTRECVHLRQFRFGAWNVPRARERIDQRCARSARISLARGREAKPFDHRRPERFRFRQIKGREHVGGLRLRRLPDDPPDIAPGHIAIPRETERVDLHPKGRHVVRSGRPCPRCRALCPRDEPVEPSPRRPLIVARIHRQKTNPQPGYVGLGGREPSLIEQDARVVFRKRAGFVEVFLGEIKIPVAHDLLAIGQECLHPRIGLNRSAGDTRRQVRLDRRPADDADRDEKRNGDDPPPDATTWSRRIRFLRRGHEAPKLLVRRQARAPDRGADGADRRRRKRGSRSRRAPRTNQLFGRVGPRVGRGAGGKGRRGSVVRIGFVDLEGSRRAVGRRRRRGGLAHGRTEGVDLGAHRRHARGWAHSRTRRHARYRVVGPERRARRRRGRRRRPDRARTRHRRADRIRRRPIEERLELGDGAERLRCGAVRQERVFAQDSLGQDGALEIPERPEGELLAIHRSHHPLLRDTRSPRSGFSRRAHPEEVPARRASHGSSASADKRVVEVVLGSAALALNVHRTVVRRRMPRRRRAGIPTLPCVGACLQARWRPGQPSSNATLGAREKRLHADVGPVDRTAVPRHMPCRDAPLDHAPDVRGASTRLASPLARTAKAGRHAAVRDARCSFLSPLARIRPRPSMMAARLSHATRVSRSQPCGRRRSHGPSVNAGAHALCVCRTAHRHCAGRLDGWHFPCAPTVTFPVPLTEVRLGAHALLGLSVKHNGEAHETSASRRCPSWRGRPYGRMPHLFGQRQLSRL